MSTIKPLLAVSGLTITFPTRAGVLAAVKDVSFEVRRGRTFGLIGQSGSGKSMTALAIAGLLPSLRGLTVEGSIRLDGIELTSLDEAGWLPLRGPRIGVVFQDTVGALDPFMRVGTQVEQALGTRGLKGPLARRRTLELLAEMEFADPSRIIDAYPHELSGGQRQRVLIAAALAGEPELLIVDEPTTSLDVVVQSQVLALLQRLRHQREMAMLFISHDLPVVRSIADDVAVLKAGRVVASGPVAGILDNPTHPYVLRLVEAERIAPATPKPIQGRRTVAVKVEGLSIAYRNRRGAASVAALSNLSLAIDEGQAVAIVGESGSGKSTLALALLGLIPPTSGQVLVHGAAPPLFRQAGRKRFTKDCQFVAQDPSAALNPRLTVMQSLQEPFHIHGGGALHPPIEDLLDEVGLETEHLGRYPHELSGGQRQRVCIARALALKPRLLICDEPVASLDFEIRGQILDLLATVGRRRGLTLLFISHDLNAVRQISERVVVLQKGLLIEDRPTEDLFSTPREPYTQALLQATPRMPDLPIASRAPAEFASRPISEPAL